MFVHEALLLRAPRLTSGACARGQQETMINVMHHANPIPISHLVRPTDVVQVASYRTNRTQTTRCTRDRKILQPVEVSITVCARIISLY